MKNSSTCENNGWFNDFCFSVLFISVIPHLSIIMLYNQCMLKLLSLNKISMPIICTICVHHYYST